MTCDALKKAIRWGDVKKVEEFFDNGGNINDVSFGGLSPLIYAIKYGHSKRAGTVKESCSSSVKPSSTNDADVNYRDVIILRLLKAGINVDVRNPIDEMTPLMLMVARRGSFEVVQALIDAGCDVNAECLFGMIALFYAIESKCELNVINALLDSGSNINHEFYIIAIDDFISFLFFAVAHENCDLGIVLSLINAGASVLTRDICGRNVLMFIQCDCIQNSYCKNEVVINLLLDKGADLKITDNENNTIIHTTNCKYLITLAIKQGLSIDEKNIEEDTPLFLAVKCGKYKKVHYLLLHNANPNSKNIHLMTPIYNFSGNRKVIELLLYHGANLLARDQENNTALDFILSLSQQLNLKVIIEMVLKHFLLFNSHTSLKDCLITFDECLLCKKFIKNCKKELQEMQHAFIKKCLTFYDFCILKETYHSKFVDISFNEYNYSYKQIKQLFPVYHDVIIKRIKDNHKKKFNVNMRSSYLQRLIIIPLSLVGNDSDIGLYFDIWYCIGNYLNTKDLYNLFLASIEN